MRCLAKNMTPLWYVKQISVTDAKDANGFFTGEKTPVYSTPVKVYMNIYPAGGEITEQIFGTQRNFDMIACSSDLVFDETTLLFFSEPTGNYFTKYDYKISAINKSLNSYNYGLSRRV